MMGFVDRQRIWPTWVICAVLTALSFFPATTAAFARASVIIEDEDIDLDEWCAENDCAQLFGDIIDSELASRLRLLESQAIERFDTKNAPETCELNRPLQPAYFALLIAPGYEGGAIRALKGSANDLAYFSAVLKERGVSSDRLKILTGATLNRDKMIRGMREMLACLRSGDQLFFSFSGHGIRLPQLGTRPIDTVVKEACKTATRLTETGLCSSVANKSESWVTLEQLYKAEISFSEKRNEGYYLTLLTNVAKEDNFDEWQSGRRPLPGLQSIEMTNFVNQVRNLNVDIFALIDTAHAGGANLAAQSKPRLWDSTVNRIELNEFNVPLTGRGQLGAFYAVNAWGEAIERNMSPLGHVSAFSYLFSESLRKLSAPSIAELSQEIRNQYDLQATQGTRLPDPVILASSPNLVFMPTTTKIEPNDRDIEIIQPVLKRSIESLVANEAPNLVLVARYIGKAKPYKAIIDGDVVDIDLNGQFRKTVDNVTGKTSIDIRVLSQDFATLSHRILSLKLSDQDIILSSAGRKLALFIANQDYEDDRFNDLQTPRSDAEALRHILTEKYGFSTAIDREDGSKLDLFLVNARRGAVSRILFELRKRLTKDDELLIFYAGHGDNIEGAGSYWVPVDGKHDEYFDWIDADDITTELKLMNPGAILLISDSCYSGGLARGETASLPPSETRDRYLAKARSFKARQLIASGGEEPVEDGGGGGHSVFAKALIDGLTTMSGVAFTASELLEQKVKPTVVNMPSALSERQIPGFHRIAKAGDEIGSEFIFVRADAARQAGTP